MASDWTFVKTGILFSLSEVRRQKFMHNFCVRLCVQVFVWKCGNRKKVFFSVCVCVAAAMASVPVV